MRLCHTYYLENKTIYTYSKQTCIYKPRARGVKHPPRALRGPFLNFQWGSYENTNKINTLILTVVQINIHN